MSVRVLSYPQHEVEDFFTKLSFSALIGELGETDSYSPFPQKHQMDNTVKIGKDLDRMWGTKSEQELINLILM